MHPPQRQGIAVKYNGEFITMDQNPWAVWTNQTLGRYVTPCSAIVHLRKAGDTIAAVSMNQYEPLINKSFLTKK